MGTILEAVVDERYERYARANDVSDSTAQADKRGFRTVMEYYGVTDSDELTDELVERAIDAFIHDTSTEFTDGSRRTYASRARKVWERTKQLRADLAQPDAAEPGPVRSQPDADPPTSESHGDDPVRTWPVHFPLRPDFPIEFELPRDLTTPEADRLAQLIRLYAAP